MKKKNFCNKKSHINPRMMMMMIETKRNELNSFNNYKLRAKERVKIEIIVCLPHCNCNFLSLTAN